MEIHIIISLEEPTSEKGEQELLELIEEHLQPITTLCQGIVKQITVNK